MFVQCILKLNAYIFTQNTAVFKLISQLTINVKAPKMMSATAYQ